MDQSFLPVPHHRSLLCRSFAGARVRLLRHEKHKNSRVGGIVESPGLSSAGLVVVQRPDGLYGDRPGGFGRRDRPGSVAVDSDEVTGEVF